MLNLKHYAVIIGVAITLISSSKTYTHAAIITDDYTNDSGIKCINISDEKNPDNKSDYEVIQEALASNGHKGIILTLAPGNYKINNLLKVFNNTTILAEDAFITQKQASKGIIINARLKDGKYGPPKGKYNSCENIKIIGGTWYANPRPSFKKKLKENGCFEGFSNFMFLHGKNITLKNMYIYNNYNGHLIEFGGIDKALVEDCDLNYDEGKYYGEFDNEAIQIDNTNTKENSPAGYPLDDTACKNITIKNCNIKYARGIGTNRFGQNNYDNIKIIGNTIETTQSEPIDIYDCKNLVINNNEINVLHKSYINSAAVVIGINYDNKKKIKPNVEIKHNKINGHIAGIKFIDFSHKGYNKVIIKNNKIRSRMSKSNGILKGHAKFKKLKIKKNKIYR